MIRQTITFPPYSGLRCLMMRYIQGDFASVPDHYAPYREIIESVALEPGAIGFLTIDESIAKAGKPHRGKRAKYGRALHTEAGIVRGLYAWGSGGWGAPRPRPTGWGSPPSWNGRHTVTLDRDVRILLANNLDRSCAIWDTEHLDTSEDGDIGYAADQYPYDTAILMRRGEVHEIGILQPHESLPVSADVERQFLRIVGSGVHGREPYFTLNPKLGETS